MDTSAIFAVAISAIGVMVTVASTLGGFAYHILDKKIAEVKRDAKDNLSDEERRRKEAIHTVTDTVNSHYETLRRDIHEVKTDIKDLRKDD
jgi:gas vesicle protein